MTGDPHHHVLPPGYRLHWYVIDTVLGQGGFGITYLAHDENLNQRVAIKEYLPRDLAVRERDDSVQPLSGERGGQFQWGLDRFIDEARTLAQFRHPNIVRVLAVFEANGTAYMAMEYEEGESLQQLLTSRKTLPEMELTRILMPLLHGVEKVHAAGFIHRDIKPANIYLRNDGSPVLLDFGSARQALGEETRTLTSLVSPGYAPFEQYVSKSDKQGPWTDIYGLGATLYRAVTGNVPSVAVDRSEALLESAPDSLRPCTGLAGGHYSGRFLQAIDHALAFRPDERPQTVAAWRSELEGGMVAAPQEAATTAVATTALAARTAKAKTAVAKPAASATPGDSTSRLRWIVAAAAILLVLWGWRHHAATRSRAHAANVFAVPAPPPRAVPEKAPIAATPVTKAPAAPVSAASAATPPVTSNATGAAVVEKAVAAPSTAKPVVATMPAPATPQATRPPGFAGGHQQRVRLIEGLAAEAKAAANRGDYRRAARLIGRALRLAPNNSQLLEARRKLAEMQGRPR